MGQTRAAESAHHTAYQLGLQNRVPNLFQSTGTHTLCWLLCHRYRTGRFRRSRVSLEQRVHRHVTRLRFSQSIAYSAV